MKSWVLIIIISLVVSKQTAAQAIGARNAAIGIQGTASSELFSSWINPAQLSALDSNALGFNYNQLNINTPANVASLMLGIKGIRNGLGIGISNFGNSFYNFSQFNIGLSQQLNTQQSMGINIQATREFIYLNDNSLALSARFGYSYHINEAFTLGAAVHAMFYSSSDHFTKAYPLLANTGSLGIHYRASDELNIHLETEISDQNNARIAAGFNYSLKKVALQLGFSNQQSLLNAGFTLPIQSFRWQLSYGFHRQLGNSLHTQILYQW